MSKQLFCIDAAPHCAGNGVVNVGFYRHDGGVKSFLVSPERYQWFARIVWELCLIYPERYRLLPALTFLGWQMQIRRAESDA